MPRARLPRQTADNSRPVSRVTAILLLLFVVVATAALAFAFRGRTSRRERAVRELLDAADTLEAHLRIARAEIEAVAGDDSDPVRVAMREMLRQRLWLQQHGATASLTELNKVRVSFETARLRLDQQLTQIERARGPLA